LLHRRRRATTDQEIVDRIELALWHDTQADQMGVDELHQSA
jgi:hypothetical protein